MRSLREITEDFDRIEREAAEFFEAVISPKIEACTTPEEFESVRRWVSDEACGKDGTIRSMPSNIWVALLWAIEARGLPVAD
jgi:hypothetical protein